MYPFHKLPYNQALDDIRIFLKHLGTSRYELLKTCHVGNTDGTEAIIAEYLNLTRLEYSALTGENGQDGGPEMQDEWVYWGYKNKSDLLDMDETHHTGLRFIKAQLLPRSGIQFSDLVDLLKTEYINPMANFAGRNTIVISHHGKQDMRYRLVRSNGVELDIPDYRRIRQFIHLWHRIGWTIDEIDKAICGLSKPAQPATINPDVLGHLVSTLKLLEITKLERPTLLTFWSPISMQGADSLYCRLFLSSGATRADPVLQLDEYGYFLSSANISQHEPLVMATLGLTKEGLDAIVATLKNDNLSIANLSFLYRHGLMAKFLCVTPTVLLEIIKIFGNPYKSPASCLKFVELWKRMEDIGFTFAQLKYVVNGDDDPVNALAQSEEMIQEILKSLLNKSVAHPKTDEEAASPATDSSTHQHETKKQLETDLVATIVSKPLGLSIETTKVLLSAIEIDMTPALQIIISCMHLEMEKKSRWFPPDVSFINSL